MMFFQQNNYGQMTLNQVAMLQLVPKHFAQREKKN